MSSFHQLRPKRNPRTHSVDIPFAKIRVNALLHHSFLLGKSMFSRYFSLLLLLVFPITSYAQSRVNIQSVERSAILSESKKRPPTRMRPKWSKIPAPYQPKTTGERYIVRWTSDSPLPAGTTVIFRYTQAKEPQTPRSLKITYPMAVSGLRHPTFTIGEKSFRSFGSVVWWAAR